MLVDRLSHTVLFDINQIEAANTCVCLQSHEQTKLDLNVAQAQVMPRMFNEASLQRQWDQTNFNNQASNFGSLSSLGDAQSLEDFVILSGDADDLLVQAQESALSCDFPMLHDSEMNFIYR